MTVDVGEDEVVDGFDPRAHGRLELMRTLRAQHGHEGVERGVDPRDGGVRAGDGVTMPRLSGHHGPVMGRHRLDLDGRVAPHLDALLPDIRLPPLAAELVAARIARIEALDVEILVILSLIHI